MFTRIFIYDMVRNYIPCCMFTLVTFTKTPKNRKTKEFLETKHFERIYRKHNHQQHNAHNHTYKNKSQHNNTHTKSQ